MWKSAVFFALLVGCSNAGIASWNEDISVHNNAAVTGIHYSQHEASVNAARKAAADRLHQSAALVANSGTSATPCGKLCYSTYGAEASTDAETIGQGIVGFTSTGAGSTAGSSQKYSSSSSRMSESSMQNIHAPAPVVYPVASSAGTRSSYTSSSSSRQHSSSSSGGAAPVLVYGPASSANNFNTRSSFSAASNEQQHVQPVTYPVANSDTSRRYVSAQQDYQYLNYPSSSAGTGNTYVLYSSKPIGSSIHYAPSRSRVDEASSFESTGRVLNLAPVQPVHSERVNEQRSQQRSESVQTVQRQPDLYPVRGTFDHQERESHHDQEVFEDEVDGSTTEQSVRLPVSTGSTSSSSSSSQRREHQNTYVRAGSYVPNTGSTNRYSTVADSQRRQQTYHSSPTYVTVAPAGGSVSSSKYESASESQHRLAQAQPSPVAASSTSNRYASSASEQRSSTLAGATGPVYYAPAGSTSYSNTASSSSHNSRYKAGSGGGFVHYPITNDEFGRQFGASRGTAGGYGSYTDLQDIMSESESLARQQAHNVHNGAVAGSGTFETDSRFGGNAESDGLGTMPGGYQRTKSWSSSSKWASEQRYGDDGKPKTYSMLSTAESEKHNINGKTTGYKAATTTLEDDGKVSTYSLHTT
ncbi:serine-rich adhesin for platelets [Anopheles nili]|uniref:serine-rich adhesin for platelets n=1 Tax=Anopheles nili TaxID=185578 RepID=UPI00237ABFFD|nr:serine-rich adhesin for platelets [Anopheles nili]